jgi:hypothetical protein
MGSQHLRVAGRLTLMLRDNHQEEMTDGARNDAQVRPKRERLRHRSKKKLDIKIEARPV